MYAGTDAAYWSAGPCDSNNVYYLTFNSSVTYPEYGGSRAYGFPVRPVSE